MSKVSSFIIQDPTPPYTPFRSMRSGGGGGVTAGPLGDVEPLQDANPVMAFTSSLPPLL